VPVSVTANFAVGDGVRFTNAEIMRELGLEVRELIRRRTLRGISADGTPFRPYAATYHQQKTKALGKASPVDLTVSGQMLNALQIVEVTDRSVTLGFA
jgi:hypothetical protein